MNKQIFGGDKINTCFPMFDKKFSYLIKLINKRNKRKERRIISSK